MRKKLQEQKHHFMKENARNARLYAKFLEDILWAFGTAEKRMPTDFELAQIREVAVKLVLDTPDVKVVRLSIEDGIITVHTADQSASEEQSFAE